MCSLDIGVSGPSASRSYKGGVKVLGDHSLRDSEEITHVRASSRVGMDLVCGCSVCNRFVKAIVHGARPDVLHISKQLGYLCVRSGPALIYS